MIFLVAENTVHTVTYPVELIDYYIDLFTGLKEQMEDIKYGSRN